MRRSPRLAAQPRHIRVASRLTSSVISPDGFGLFALLSRDQIELVLQCLAVEDIVRASWVCEAMRGYAHQLARQPAFADAFWSAHWQTWHTTRGTTALALGFMMSMDASRLPPGHDDEWWHEGWDRCELATDDRKPRGTQMATVLARSLQYRADRSWPRETAAGSVDACMAELGRRGQRYRTLAAFNLLYDDTLETTPPGGSFRAIDPPRHRAIISDMRSCELIMRLNGDGTGRIRGFPKRSVYSDRDEDGEWIGSEGLACMDGAITTLRAGSEAFLTVVTEVHSDDQCYAPCPCFARVRLIKPGQTFTVAHTIDNEHKGTAMIQSQGGDLELCFHGSLGNYCHIMRQVPAGKWCADPLEGEFGREIANPAGNWWENDYEPLFGGGMDFHSWYTYYDLDGEEVTSAWWLP